MPQPDQALIAKRAVVSKEIRELGTNSVVIDDVDGLRAFECDALTAYRKLPLLVILPETTEDVSKLMKYCNNNNIKVIARGAGTSLSGGALPEEDAIVVGISRMNQVLDVSYENRTARVQSGVTNLEISSCVSEKGFFYAPDPSSQLACTLAGNIAMNSGGAHCLRYGVTANNLLGAKIVLMDGEILQLGGELLDCIGYDLLGLFTGSEGQLGIVTEAIVRIIKKPEAERPMLIGFSSVEDAGACAASIIASGIIPVALEFMDSFAIKVCEEFSQAGYPLDSKALLIVEVEGSQKEITFQLEKILDISKKHSPIEIKISSNDEESKRIWRGRKSAFGALGRISDYICVDGTIPTGRLPYVLKSISSIGRKYNFRIANIFHAGDGNLHPIVLYNPNDRDELKEVERCCAEILALCVEVGGCLSGEHGIGIEKRELMPLQFTQQDLEQQMCVKDVFDSRWLLNSAKVFPLGLNKSRLEKFDEVYCD
jgi:glycolate oxidase